MLRRAFPEITRQEIDKDPAVDTFLKTSLFLLVLGELFVRSSPRCGWFSIPCGHPQIQSPGIGKSFSVQNTTKITKK